MFHQDFNFYLFIFFFDHFNYLPEIFLGSTLLAQLIYNVYARKGASGASYFLAKVVAKHTQIILILTLILLYVTHFAYTSTFADAFHILTRAHDTRVIILVFAILLVYPIQLAFQIQRLQQIEFYTLYLITVLSCLLLLHSTCLLDIFLLIELQTLTFYILACFRPDSSFSATGALRYFIFGSVISCLFAYLLSLTYGFFGTLDMFELGAILVYEFEEDMESFNYLFGVFIIIGFVVVFFIKLGVAPFHYWAPDVYDGAPIAATIIFTVLPKIVFLDILIRMSIVFGDSLIYFYPIMLCLGAFTIAIGSLLSIKETRLKRFILYASITQVGFVILMLGTSDLVEESKSYIMTFIILYSASMLAFWGIYIILYSYFNKLDQFTNKSDSKEARNEIMISDLSGSFISNKPIAILYSILMFCLGSLPPFTGFYTKYLAMNALVNAEYFFIATFVLFMSLIAMVYYFQFITVAFVSKKEGEREAIRLNYGLEQEELSVMRITIVSFIIMLCGIELADSLEWLFSYLYTDIYGTGIF